MSAIRVPARGRGRWTTSTWQSYTRGLVIQPGRRIRASPGFRHLDGAEALERAVHEEHLHGELGLDVGVAEEGKHPAAGQLLDGALVVLGHHALEVLPHVDHTLRL